METLVDDVGSLPLPSNVTRESFEGAYALARRAIASKKGIDRQQSSTRDFYQTTIDSFRKKAETGLDVITYPQHYDMQKQLADPLKEAMNRGTYLIDESQAFLPEVHVIRKEAESLSEELNRKILLRICILGPMEFYLREIGTTAYRDVLMMFAENVKRFAKNSILDTRHVKTAVISLDEPSFGFREIAVERDTLHDVLEKAFDFSGVVTQLHLHSASRMVDVLEVKNINVLSCEYAASPKNIESISRKMLDAADKQIRVGISRTDIDSIMAELHDKNITKPTAEQMVESKQQIRERYRTAKEKYGDRMTYTGPDCGLGGWPSQEAALLLLKRTVNAVKNVES